MTKPSIRNIERLNYVIAGIATIAAVLTQTRAIALGIAVGGGLTCLNFFVLRKLVTKWTADAANGTSSNAAYLMLPKMIGLMGAVVVAILVLPLDPIAFIMGYSIFIMSITIESALSTLRQPNRDSIDG
jgi:hypothetical protein